MTPKVQHSGSSGSNKNTSTRDDSEDELNLSDDEGRYVEGIYIPPALKPTLSFDPTGPRLIITKITNNFFKSYANQQVLGPFHKCFNAIVGPNGSGKSNVIDSMLFVFGYRATKIRCKKVSVLVHKSESFRDVQSCSVAVHFALILDKPGDEYEIIPGSEFVVKRTANKDNSSFYELNGNRVQFKDIGVLLRKHGIDLVHNRFLILQGEVEQIAMMKCKSDNENESGMLEYLEDIIGTSRYKQPLVQVFDKLEVLSDMRTEKINRLNIVEKEMESLKAPMEEAVEFLKTENSLVHNKNFLYQKNILNLQNKISKDEEDFQEIVAEQNAFVEKLETLEAEKTEKEKVLSHESSEYAAIKKESDKLKQCFDKISKRDEQLVGEMANKVKKRKELKATIIKDNKKLEQLAKVPEENAKTVIEFEAKLEETIAKKAKQEEEREVILRTVSSETKELQQQKETMQKDLAVLKEAAAKTKSAFNIAETQLRMFLESEGIEQKKLETLQAQYETTKRLVQERTEQLADLKRRIPETEKALQKASDELDQVKKDESKALPELRTKQNMLTESKSSMQASSSRGRVLDSLMRAKHEGKCPGLFGRLGDLGAIDPKFDVAVSTACGPLDNIVVDTADTAKWCIEFLKKHDIGRAVFIALEKQEHLRNAASRQIQTPEGVPRLYDLIKIQDERVKPAFYYGLRDTLVANDLEQGSRIAYGATRYRVVTLKGELIETSGTMSGGGRAMKGRMGQSVLNTNVDPKQLANMEEEVQSIQQFVRELRQKQTALDNRIETLIPELRTMKFDCEKVAKEVDNLKQQIPNLKKQIKDQEVRANNAPKGDPRELEKVVEKKRKENETATEAADALQAQVDKLVKEINEKTTGKLRGVNKAIKDMSDFITKCKSEISRLKVAGKTAERTHEKTAQSIQRMEKEVTDLENSLREMAAEREQIEADGRNINTRIEEITSEIADKEQSNEGILKEVSNIEKKIKQLKTEKIDVDNKVKDMKKKIDSFKHQVHAWEAKLKTLTLQDIINESVEELKKYTEEELKERNTESVEKQIEAAEAHLKSTKPNINAIQEYRKIQTVYVERSKELSEVAQKRAEMRKVYDELRDNRKNEFMKGFQIIRMKLKEMYQMITLGGDADLELVDSYDPFTEGVQLNIRPPKKSWKKISNLSGGEKTLSSLALVFALHYYKPSPLYVMDEIDAALDYKNVSIVANYIKERNKNAQFIIITLRDNMFDLCDNMIGIYKTHHCTKSVTICPKMFASPANNENAENNQNVKNRNTHQSTSNILTTSPPAVMNSSSSSVSRKSNKTSQESRLSVEKSIPDSFETSNLSLQKSIGGKSQEEQMDCSEIENSFDENTEMNVD